VEGETGDLGIVTWGARLRLDELEADISRANQLLSDFYQKNQGPAMAGFPAGAPAATGGVAAGGSPAAGWGGIAAGPAVQGGPGNPLAGAPGAALGGPIYNYGSHYGPPTATGAYTMGGAIPAVSDYLTNYGSNYGPVTSRGTFRSGGYDIAATRSEDDLSFKQFLFQEKTELRGRTEVDSWRQQASDRYVSRFMSESRAANTLGPEDLIRDDEEGGVGGRGGGSGIFSLRALTRKVGAGVLAYEALRIGQGYQESNESLRLAGPNLGDQLTAYQQRATIIEGVPFLGQAASIVAHGILQNNPLGIASALFGTGNLDPDKAIYDANNSVAMTGGFTNALIAQRGASTGVQHSLQESQVITTFGSYSRTIQQAIATDVDTKQALNDKNYALQQQIDDLRSGPQTAETAGQANALQLELNQRQRDYHIQAAAADLIRNATFQAVGVDLGLAKDALGRGGAAQTAIANGQFGAAAGLNFEAQLQTEYAAADPLIKPALAAYQNLQRQANAAQDIEGMRQLEAGTSSLQLELAHQPQAAQLNDIEEGRRSGLANAAYLPTNTGTSADQANQLYNDRLKSDINAKFDTMRDLTQQQYREKAGDISYGIAAERASIAALNQLNPDTTLSTAIGIRATTYQRVVELARAGFVDQAHEESAKGQEEIGLAEGEFIRGFRGVEVDPRHININAPRGSVNVALRLKEMEDQKKLLVNQNTTFEMRMHVGAFAKGGAVGTPGAIGSISNMSLDDLTKAIQAAIKGSITN